MSNDTINTENQQDDRIDTTWMLTMIFLAIFVLGGLSTAWLIF